LRLNNLQAMLRTWFLAIIIASLTGCGFHMSGLAELPFKSIYIQGNTLAISKKLKKSFHTNGVTILESADNADLLLELMSEENEKRILSISGKGVVNEYEIFYRVHYRTKHIEDPTWSQVNTIETRRDYSYNDADLLAKQLEEKKLNESMQNDAISSLMRRLAALKS